MLMNPRKFDSLPSDLQAIIERNSGKALSERFATAWDTATTAAQETAPAEGQVSIDAVAYQEMRQASAPVIEQWIREAGERGLDGAGLVQGVRALSGNR